MGRGSSASVRRWLPKAERDVKNIAAYCVIESPIGDATAGQVQRPVASLPRSRHFLLRELSYARRSVHDSIHLVGEYAHE